MIMTVVLTVAALLVAGCEAQGKFNDPNYIPSENELTRIAEEWPDDDPLKPTAQAVALERFATAQAFEGQAQAAEATRQAADYEAQQRYVLLTAEAQMTAEAHQRDLQQQHTWATQQSANATQVAQATAQAVAIEATQQAIAIRATMQQRAWEATSTAEALNRAATATAEALSREATATAQYRADVATWTAEAVAFEQTSTKVAWEGKTTATAESVHATSAAYAATATRATEKREEVLGYGRDYGIPFLLLVICGGLAALVIYAIRQQAQRPVVYPRNLLGDAEPMGVKDKNGGWTFIDLDRQPGPAIQVLPSGQVAAPLLRSVGQEERTTARDQMLDAVARPKLGGGQKAQAPVLPAPPQAPAPGLRSVRMLRQLGQAEKAGFLPPPLVASLAADWEEEA